MDEHVAELTLPAVGLGTMRLRGRECRSLVEAALAEGYRHIDTARMYGNEEDVGAGIRRSSVARGDVILATKVWHDELEPHRVTVATEESLGRLGVDYVDLLLVHWPSRTVPVEDTLEAMGALRDAGKARFLGVANFPSGMLEKVAGTPGLIGDQVEYHPYLAQEAVLSVIRACDLVLTAYCPLGRAGPLLEDDVLRAVASECGRTLPQVVLRWLVQQERVVAIPGTSSIEHLRENLSVHDFELGSDHMEAIGSLARGDRVVDPPHAPTWD